MSNELNLSDLDWTAITCPGCSTVTEVFADDLSQLIDDSQSIRCPNCNETLRQPGKHEEEHATHDHDSAAGSSDETVADQRIVEKSKPQEYNEPINDQSEPDVVDTNDELQDSSSNDLSGTADISNCDREPKAWPISRDDLEQGRTEAQSYEIGLSDDDDYSEFEIDTEYKSRRRSQRDKARAARRKHSKNQNARWVKFKEKIAQRRDDFAGIIVSTVIHLVLLLILALIVFELRSRADNAVIVSIADGTFVELDVETAEIELQADELDAPSNLRSVETRQVSEALASTTLQTPASEFAMPDASAFDSLSVAENQEWAFQPGTGFEGRTAEKRRQMALKNGGTEASENAVELGLDWLAKHQLTDGSWCFQESLRVEGCDCGMHGVFVTKTGATGMSLLAFLGAGYTHRNGKHQAVVQSALDWLVRQSDVGDFRVDKQTATDLEQRPGMLKRSSTAVMYSHGLCAIALCEAYGMTKDRVLLDAAKLALKFIEDSQHHQGGWRYLPRTPGDTSVVGWQVMAIVSGRMSNLHVNRIVTGRTIQFLDRVYDHRRGSYGYTDRYRSHSPATTAIGALCRMYLHYGFDRNKMNRTIRRVAATSPLRNDAYTNYYSAQVLHQYGGPLWEKWNSTMRDRLVATQVKQGHAAGSWPIDNNPRGAGRLYQTAMSVMTLEVYYRHLPIYRKEATVHGQNEK